MRSWIAIPVFARDFHLAGQTRQLLDPVAGDTPGQVASATSHDGDRLHATQKLLGPLTESAIEYANPANPTFQGAFYHFGLLEHLFLHEMTIVAALHVVCFHFHANICPNHRCFVDIPYIDAIWAQIYQVTFFQKYETIRYRTKRENIRGQKVLANPLAQNQWTALSRSNDALIFTRSDHRQGIGAFETTHSLSDRL